MKLIEKNIYTPGDYSQNTSDSFAVMETLVNDATFSERTLLKNIRKQYRQSKVSRNDIPRAGFGSLGRFDAKDVKK